MTLLAVLLSAWLGIGVVLSLFVLLSARSWARDGADAIALSACFLFLWPCLLGMMVCAALLDRLDRRREGERA